MVHVLSKIKLFVFTAVIFLFLGHSSKNVNAFEDVRFVQELNSGYEEPVDVAVSGEGEIFILDRRLAKVFVYDETGYYLRSFGAKGSGSGELNRPQSLVLTPQNEILVADTGNNRIVAFDQDGQFLFSFGSSGSSRGQFQSPTGVAADSNGFILVADSRNQRVQIFSPKGVYRYHIPFADQPTDVSVDINNTFYVLRPQAGIVSVVTPENISDARCMTGQKNYVDSASGLTVDMAGNIYITEGAEHSIKKFNSKAGLLLSFGSEGKSRGQFKNPAGIFVDQNNKIYAVDTRNKRVQILQNKGNTTPPIAAQTNAVPMIDYQDTIAAGLSLSDIQISPIGEVLSLSDKNSNIIIHGAINRIVGSIGREEGQFSGPSAFDYGLDGRIYVADTRNNRIQIFDQDGQFEYAFGERGSKTGQFNAPQGVVVNSHGIIYVADTQNNRIQMFNKDGIFLMSFGTASEAKKDENPVDGTFLKPTALAVNANDDLYVLDSGNNRYQVFNEKGHHLQTVGTLGESYGQLNNPVDIAIDPDNYIYVAEQGNHRVQIFPPGNKQSLVFGSSGPGYGDFQELTGIEVYQDKIYVTDGQNSGIRVYRFEKNFKQVQNKPKIKDQEPKEEIQNDEDKYELR